MQSLDFFTKGIRPYVFITLLITILSLPGVFSMPVMDRDEARFTQASAQMLETGDYVVIRFHDGLRNKKPVGIHWLQAASVASLSDVEKREIWAFRVPSFLGAIMAALATFWAGSLLFNRRAAFAGAILLGSSLLLSSEAHIAKTDAAMVGFICLFMACLAQLRVRHNEAIGKKAPPKYAIGNKSISILFWFAMAWGVLIKGPVAPMVAALAIVMLAAWERRLLWLKPLAFWPGPVLFVWMALPWFIAVQVATNGVFLTESVGVDLGPKLVSGAEGHSAPPGTHLLGLPLLIWPAILFVIPGLAITIPEAFKLPVQKGKKLPPLSGYKFILAWLVPTWIVFEAMPTKLAHYPMPTYPALALMAGIALDRLIAAGKDTPPIWSRWASFGLFSLASILLIIILSPWGIEALRAEAASDFGREAARVGQIWENDWNAVGAPIWPFLLAILAVAATLYLFIRKQFQAVFLSLIACSLIVGGSLRAVILPNQSWIIATDAAMKALDEICGYPENSAAHLKATHCIDKQPPKIVRAITYAEPSFVFSINGKVYLPPKSAPDIPPITEETRPVWLINTMKPAGAQALKELVLEAASANRCVRLARQFVKNYSNDDASELVAVAIEPGYCDPAKVLSNLKQTQLE